MGEGEGEGEGEEEEEEKEEEEEEGGSSSLLPSLVDPVDQERTNRLLCPPD